MPQVDDRYLLLMQEALKGSQSAARELIGHYEPYLLETIRGKLHRTVRSQFDSLDFSQDVWASFFAVPLEKRVFKDAEHLLNFLTAIARNKVAMIMRQRLMSRKRNVNLERSLDDSQAIDKETLISGQETPSRLAMKDEDWNRFLKGQPLVYQRIFRMLREGHTREEVARELGINVRTVTRVVARYSTETSS